MSAVSITYIFKTIFGYGFIFRAMLVGVLISVCAALLDNGAAYVRCRLLLDTGGAFVPARLFLDRGDRWTEVRV